MTHPAPPAAGSSALPSEARHVACPSCGLLCDDLVVRTTATGLAVSNTDCARGKAFFERKRPAAEPRVAGKPVNRQDAIAAAAALIRESRLPLYGGLATDVEGVRALIELAETSRGILDHALGDAVRRNMTILQSRGWMLTTLTEARNRADLFIIVAADLDVINPGFYKRIVAPAEAMFVADGKRRTVVLIGASTSPISIEAAGTVDIVRIPTPDERVGNVLAALRARLKSATVSAQGLAGVSLAAIDDLAARCRTADYGVIAWAPAALSGAAGDIVVEQVTELIKDLNVTQRFAGLSLGGNEGVITAAAVCAWQSGYPLRVSYQSGAPVYDPTRHALEACLARGDGDVLVWTATLSADTSPPATRLPLIVLGTPGLALAREPDVLIPVGSPGLDHAGRMVRVDNVVTLPLRRLVDSGLPSVPDVASAIRRAL
ncbi:MAG: formylmethanofuran dehydrogenase [Hyphomicrobiaceae bacterium]|nr:formylmethanofuran dehydrogenase [Hyphomicrobiaceae bacterium]